MANKDFKVKNGIDVQTPIPVSMGGTGQTSTTNTLNSLLPAQGGNANKILSTDGTNTTWVTKPTEYTVGNTAARPGSPTNGVIHSNTELGYPEFFNGTTWIPIGAVPTAPSGVTATNQGSGRAFNNGQASVAFTPGTVPGSTYTVTSSPGGYTNTGSSSPITITGLQSNTAYTYTVISSSVYGTSAASAASAAVTATTVPQAPTIGTATAGDAQASVTFTAGATGGSTITSYTVTSSPGNITASGASSPITVTGLTNGTAYTFTVTATNANGTSTASAASSSVTPSIVSSYESIATITVGAGGTANIDFTNIPQTYSHLQIRGFYKTNRDGDSAMYTRLNNDTTNNYSYHSTYGDGGSTGSFGGGILNTGSWGNVGPAAANVFATMIMDILDYSSSAKNTTVRVLHGQDNNGSGGVVHISSFNWRISDPVTTIRIFGANGAIQQQYSHFALYGIKVA